MPCGAFYFVCAEGVGFGHSRGYPAPSTKVRDISLPWILQILYTFWIFSFASLWKYLKRSCEAPSIRFSLHSLKFFFRSAPEKYIRSVQIPPPLLQVANFKYLSRYLKLPMRRGWDSNPRRGFPRSGFQDRCIRPLCHPSNIIYSIIKNYSDYKLFISSERSNNSSTSLRSDEKASTLIYFSPSPRLVGLGPMPPLQY